MPTYVRSILEVLSQFSHRNRLGVVTGLVVALLPIFTFTYLIYFYESKEDTLALIDELLQAEEYEACINKAEIFQSNSEQTDVEVLSLLHRCYLGKAADLAKEEDYEKAIETLFQIPRESEYYSNSEDAIESYYQLIEKSNRITP